MPGRNPHGAVQAFLEPLRASSSCITQTQWVYNMPKQAGDLGVATLGAGDLVSIRRGEDKLWLESGIQFTVIRRDEDKFGNRVGSGERFKVSTRGYKHTIFSEDMSEMIAYHWHPEAKGDIEYPHQHINTGPGPGSNGLNRKLHLRTGRLSFEDIVFNLIQLGAVPRNLNFATILESNRALFERWKSWG